MLSSAVFHKAKTSPKSGISRSECLSSVAKNENEAMIYAK
jgi:hypothetical protein